MVGNFPISIHIGALVFVANIAQHESTPIINLTWGLKVLGPPMKDLGMAILKSPSQLAQS
jgi:hypothetical protein